MPEDSSAHSESSVKELRTPPQLTIVVPCYNEEQVLPETIKQLCALLEQVLADGQINTKSSVVFVDDGSRDKTWALIEEHAESNFRVHGLKLSRNRGHQHALLAGLHSVEGDVVVSIDADLQDDIQVIAKMVQAYRSGNDVVFGVRNERTTDSWFKRFTAEKYYDFLGIMGVELVHNHADFRLLSRKALEALKAYDEVNLFIRGVIPTLGFPSTTVEYRRGERLAGESKYPLHKMISLAIQGVTSFSPTPLRLIAGLGFGVSLISLLLMLWALYVRLVDPQAVPGWASSVIPIYFIGGIQLLSLGVVGEYVAKIYVESKRRPRFFIDKEV